jgi:hypothetical protein
MKKANYKIKLQETWRETRRTWEVCRDESSKSVACLKIVDEGVKEPVHDERRHL